MTNNNRPITTLFLLQSLIGGESLHTQEDLEQIKALKLVKNETEIE